MHHRSSFLFVVLPLVASFVPAGCIRLFPEVRVPAPDPQADRLAYVADTDGRSLVLGDGSKVELMALDVSGLSEYQRRQMRTYLRQVAGVERDAPREGPRPGVLLPGRSDVQSATLSVPYMEMRFVCGFQPTLSGTLLSFG